MSIELTKTYLAQVWPAFWSKGPQWPDNGEIDIIEGVNLMVCFFVLRDCRMNIPLRRSQSANQYALHTAPGCSQPRGVLQTGVSGTTDCSQPSGCLVSETKPNSYGEAFATAGGGVWATQFDVAGILCVDVDWLAYFSRTMALMTATASGSGMCAPSLSLARDITHVVQS